MREVKILHAADLHLDSPFEGLPPGKASMRRSEQRELLMRMAELAREECVDLVLLAGDLLDSDNTYYETGTELARALRLIPAPVFIAPGNHDWYSPKSPYARLKLPENVCVFHSSEIECVTMPNLSVRVFGAAFTDRRSGPLLRGFTADREDGLRNILCIHGEVGAKTSPYNPVSEEEIAESGMDYIGFGHVHKAGGLRKAGDTWYSWPGCPEGRGFDETGEKTVSIVTLSDAGCTLETRSIALRRYENLRIDITGTEPLLAIHTSLPDETIRDVYRITLCGETDVSPDMDRIYDSLDELFFELQLRDETRMRANLWEHSGDDTLRGLFLKKLKAKFDAARDDRERRSIEQAVRWGLAALDNREEVVRHDDP